MIKINKLQKPIIIHLDEGDKILYFKGQKFAEEHSLSDKQYIKFGMLMKEAGFDISDINKIFLGENDISDESLLWNWTNDIDNLNEEIKNIILKQIDN